MVESSNSGAQEERVGTPKLDPQAARIKLQREFSGENKAGVKEESLRLKDYGNELFKQGQYQQAIQTFS